ncbi:MAG: protein-L-isoaspartate O-methyltransferase [Patescibacteria group bacterium]
MEYENLIDSLIKDGYLKTPEIIEAFKAIDRANFVPDELKGDAYINAPLPIGFGQTISQPLTVAFMFELLQPKKGEKILDVGVGSGWTAALLAFMVGEAGKIIGVERIPELKEMAEKNILQYGFVEKGIISVFLGDGSKGYKEEALYDKIIAAAAAKEDIPVEWKKQLKIGGKIVAPVENSIVVIDKTGKDEYNKKEYFGFSFVPLITNN